MAKQVKKKENINKNLLARGVGRLRLSSPTARR